MDNIQHNRTVETITLGGGCYWCIEAVFKQLKGIEKVQSGFSGGEDANPRYQDVCSGQSDHIEVVRVSFDSRVLPLEQLLAVFFAAHDPTTLNRQGNDVGPQYRSVVFYHNEQQRQATLSVIDAIEQSRIYKDKVVTEVRPVMPFYIGPDYHQDFYNDNRYSPYCQLVIDPKLDKIRALFADCLST